MTTKIVINRKNRNFAIDAAAPAMVVKPNTAAMSAMTRKINDHLNMKYAKPRKEGFNRG